MVQVYLSLGSNIEAEQNICSCLHYLRSRFGSIVSSTVYQTPAVGFAGQPFLNLVVGFATELDIGSLRVYLHKLEDAHGRVRGGAKFSSRTLDVDLLLYGDAIQRPEDNLPHPDILKYPFVLFPLAEIAPQTIHPVLRQDFQQIARDSTLSLQATPITLHCLQH